MEQLKGQFADYLFESRVGNVLQIIPIMLLVGGVFWLLRGRWLKKHGRSRSGPFREAILFIFVCYLTGLISLICTPSNFWIYIWFYVLYGYPGTTMSQPFSGGISLVPVIIKILSGEYVVTGFSFAAFLQYGNALLFLPFGLLLPAIRRDMGCVKTVAAGFALSLFVEGMQLIVGRIFDIDDLIMNTLGTLIGYILYFIIKSVFRKKEVTT